MVLKSHSRLLGTKLTPITLTLIPPHFLHAPPRIAAPKLQPPISTPKTTPAEVMNAKQNKKVMGQVVE